MRQNPEDETKINDDFTGNAWSAPLVYRASITLSEGTMVGRYRIIRLIGEGGMGAVYEAEQEQSRRTVALKIIKPGFVNPELLRRFEMESQALGRLQHPGIAQIYEAGAADTGFGLQPYFAMEFIKGRTLSEYVAEHSLKTRERLEIFAKVADAVHHAHQRGLIHRDLKPGNILVDETGQPKILDFGVARATDSDSQATMQTDLGQLVGTLAYMSPEQVMADPNALDTRSDVYALGVILYELLAGRLPYTISKDLHETIMAIRETDPSRLSAVNRTYRGDIETIVAKALEKDKTRRYASAAEMAADIGRYLRDEPIIARPPTASYQLKKFTRRNKPLVFAAGTIFVVMIAATVVSLREAVVARRAEQTAKTALEQVKKALQDVLTAEQNARQAREAATGAKEQEGIAIAEAQQALERAAGAKEQEAIANSQAQQAREGAAAANASAKSQRILAVWQSLVTETVRDSASRVDDDRAALLARQAFLLQARSPAPSQNLIEDVLQKAGAAEPWSHILAKGSDYFSSVAYSRDGSHLAAGSADKSVWVWDARNYSLPPVRLEGPKSNFNCAEFSPDGNFLGAGSANNNVYVWDLRNSGAAPVMFKGLMGQVYAIAFSMDGLRMVAAGIDKSVLMWDRRNPNAPPVVFQYPQTRVNAAVFSSDNTHLAVGGDDKNVLMWDVRNPKLAPVVFSGFQNDINTVAFTPDGTRIAASGQQDKTIRMWSVANPASAPVLFQGSPFVVRSIAFARGGFRLAGAGGTAVRVWDVQNPDNAPIAVEGPQSAVRSITFSSDNTRLAIASDDRTVRIADMRDAEKSNLVLQGPKGTGTPSMISNSVSFSPDASHVASATRDQILRVWDLRKSGDMPVQFPGQQGTAISTAYSSDGSHLISASTDCSVRTWDLRTPETSMQIQGPKADMSCLALSPDGARLASVSADNSIRIWNVKNPSAPAISLARTQGSVQSMAFSSDGMVLAVGSTMPLVVRIFDLRNTSAAPTVLQAGAQVQALAFSHDGTRLAGALASTVRLWNMRNTAADPVVLQASAPIFSAAFSPDDMRVAAGTSNGILLVWDLQNTAAPLASIQISSGAVSNARSLMFSHDGLLLAMGNGVNVRVSRFGAAASDYLCTRVWRNLSMEEWTHYIGPDFPYEKTCPALPPGAGAPGGSK